MVYLRNAQVKFVSIVDAISALTHIGRFFYESLFLRFKFNNGNPIVKTKIENLSRYKNLDKICVGKIWFDPRVRLQNWR